MISKIISVFLNRFIFNKKKIKKTKNIQKQPVKKYNLTKSKKILNRPLNWIAKKYNMDSKTLKIALFFIAISSLFFGTYVKTILIITIFIIVAVISKLAQEIFPFVVGFDFVLFVTVLSSLHYGWFIGALVGCLSSFIGSMYRIRQQIDTAIMPLIGYVAVAIMVPYIAGLEIFILGIICTIVYSIIMSLIFLHLRADIFNTATFVITTILFNWWLFKNLAPIITAIM
ncbi:MAG: hypothetical protein KAS12_03295 [Candidatus Aenigmarchaeota archaeon]|nr:hypothetical protein [Candidatus Aenigmarchaeota archaeon]